MNGKILIIFTILLIFATCNNIMAKIVEGDKLTRLYVLKDPITEHVRYVGKTVKPLEYRLASHIYDAKRIPHRHVCNWIKRLQKDGQLPIIEEIDLCSWEESQVRETHWIRFFRSCGCKLTNHTDGGEGNLGHKASVETLDKMRAAWSNKTKKIYQYSITGKFIAEHANARDAAKTTNCLYGNILQACSGEKKSHGSYLWSYVKTSSITYARLPVNYKRLKKIDCFTLTDEYIKTFNSIGEASRELKVRDPNIHKVLRGIYNQTGGYKFKVCGN